MSAPTQTMHAVMDWFVTKGVNGTANVSILSMSPNKMFVLMSRMASGYDYLPYLLMKNRSIKPGNTTKSGKGKKIQHTRKLNSGEKKAIKSMTTNCRKKIRHCYRKRKPKNIILYVDKEIVKNLE